MLILTRKPGTEILIGDDVRISFLNLRGNQMRVGIQAPDDVVILRNEVLNKIIRECEVGQD